MAELTVDATIDSFMSETEADGNNGDQDFMVHDVVYSGEMKLQWRRSIVNFDVSALAGATINSAKLTRHIWSITNGGQSARLSRCTRPADWTEGGVTWNKYDGANSWTNGGGDVDDTGPPAKVDYTEPTATGDHDVTGLEAFVTDALDNRANIVPLITRLVDEDPGVTTQYAWRSIEYGSDIWRLVIDYTPSPGGGFNMRNYG